MGGDIGIRFILDRIRALVFLALIAWATPASAINFTGKGGVWYWVGDSTSANFTSQNKPGTRTGIQQALDTALPTKQLEVQLGPGVFDLDSTLWVHGNTRIRGAGMGVTILRRSAFSESYLANKGHVVVSAKYGTHDANLSISGGLPTDSLASISIENLTIDGNSQSWPTLNPNSPGNMGIQFWFVDGVSLVNVEVRNTLQTGIEMDACRNVTMDGIWLRKTGQQLNLGSRNGININNNSGNLNASVNWAKNTTLSNIHITDQKDAAIDIANNSGVTIDNVIIQNEAVTDTAGNYAFEHEGSLTGYTARDFSISNVIAKGIRGSFYRLSLGTQSLERLSVKNCHATFRANSSNSAGEAIMLGRTNDFDVHDVLFESCTFDSINTSNSSSGSQFATLGWAGTTPSSRITLRDLSFVGASGGTLHTSNPSVFVYGNVQDVLLENVRVYNSENVGFMVTPGSASFAQHNIRLKNCLVDGAQAQGYLVGSNSVSATINGVVVDGCVAKDTNKNASGAVFDVVGSFGTSTVKNVTIKGNRIISTSGTNMATGCRVFQSGSVTTDSVWVLDNDFQSAATRKYQTSGTPTNVWWRDLQGTTFALLPAVVSDGSALYCNDCQEVNPCVGSGSGAIASRIAGAWSCGGGSGSGGGNGDSLENNAWIYWKDSGGTYRPAIKVDSTNTLRFQAYPSGNNYIDFYRTDGVLGARFYGANGNFNVTNNGRYQLSGYDFLSTNSNDQRIHSKSNVNGGVIAFRDSANANNILTVANDGATRFFSTVSQYRPADVASSASITLGVGNVFKLTGTTTLDNITAKTAGTVVYVLFSGFCKVEDGVGNIKLNGDFQADGSGDDDVLVLYCDGTNWLEVSRSLN